MAEKTLKGDFIVLDLSPNGGGQLHLRNNSNDNKIFLEGFSSDGKGHASEILITGNSAQPLPNFTVVAEQSVIQCHQSVIRGTVIAFSLNPNGGGQLHLRNNSNDNRVYLQGVSANGITHADEIIISGVSAQNLPLFSVLADQTRFFGDIEATGDIRLTNADCAEDFDISDAEQIEPGTVMVLGTDGKLEKSQKAYDKRVAGVISGAGDYKPGIVLDKQQAQNGRKPVALLGKVFCKVDARYGGIEIGDLLTTSDTPGHAMKATDLFKVFGTVIGKALRPLNQGQGLIPILIALQ
jgi:hypothetical protein